MDALVLGLRVLISLAAVLGVMWLLYRRFSRGNPGAKARALSVVARQSVGPKASVVVLDTDGKRFLLGVTEHGITVLHTGDLPVPVPGSGPVATLRAVRDPALGDSALGDPAQQDHGTGQEAGTIHSLGSTEPTRRSGRRAAAFDAVLDAQLGTAPAALPGVPGESAAQPGAPAAGSILDPATWRLAAAAVRSGRRR